ncbi:hypothetical protein D3C81_1929030 [compost metagenome]
MRMITAAIKYTITSNHRSSDGPFVTTSLAKVRPLHYHRLVSDVLRANRFTSSSKVRLIKELKSPIAAV